MVANHRFVVINEYAFGIAILSFCFQSNFWLGSWIPEASMHMTHNHPVVPASLYTPPPFFIFLFVKALIITLKLLFSLWQSNMTVQNALEEIYQKHYNNDHAWNKDKKPASPAVKENIRRTNVLLIGCLLGWFCLSIPKHSLLSGKPREFSIDIQTGKLFRQK